MSYKAPGRRLTAGRCGRPTSERLRRPRLVWASSYGQSGQQARGGLTRALAVLFAPGGAVGQVPKAKRSPWTKKKTQGRPGPQRLIRGLSENQAPRDLGVCDL